MANKGKQLTKSELIKFGLDENYFKFVDTLDELANETPNVVTVRCLKNFQFLQNKQQLQTLKKKVDYVMSLGIYQQLRVDKNIRLLKPSDVKFKNLYRKYSGEDLNNKTLLVWRTGGIGDLLFIQPNLIYLKEKYPTSKIIFACSSQYQAMVEDWDCIDDLIDLPFSVSYIHKSDYHIIFEGVIERCNEATYTNSYRLFTKWLNLNLPDEYLRPRLTAKPNLIGECKEILSNWDIDINNDNIILLQIRASSPIRTPSPRVFSKLVNELTNRNYKVVITDSPQQSNRVDLFIKQKVNDKDKVFNFSQYSKSIDYTIAIASLATCCISVDSSLIHIAQGVNTPVFGIYGPFPGDIRMSTYTNCDWIDCDSLPCSPCYRHGKLPCRNSDISGYSMCFEELDPKLTCDKIDDLF